MGAIGHIGRDLDADTAAVVDNVWTPREYLACGLPMMSGSRLRITAVDTGSGILEAAIDSVSIHAYDDPAPCEPGEGGACDPELPNACPGELSCCSQGALNVGVYRCEVPVAGLDYENPTSSSDASAVSHGRWCNTVSTASVTTVVTASLMPALFIMSVRAPP